VNYIGYAGVGDQIGTAEEPVVPNFQIADLLGGALTPVMGILAALIDARSSGRGRHVDVAMTDAVFAHAIFPLLGFLEHGRTPPRGSGMLGGGLPCYNVYRTRDDGLTQPALPLKFSEFEFGIGRPAPGRGEHTEEILREAGYREAEIAALRGDGVI